MLPKFAIALLQKSLNAYLNLDPETLPKLIPLHGKIVLVRITEPMTQEFYLIVTRDGFLLQEQYEGSVDTIISGSAFSLLKMSWKMKTGKTVMGDVTITGDMGLGETIQQIFSQMDIDWEDHLSRVMGDTLAHGVASLASRGKDFLQQLCQTAEKNMTEVLQEEINLVPNAEEVEDFYEDISLIKDDVERLQQRVERLQKNLEDESE